MIATIKDQHVYKGIHQNLKLKLIHTKPTPHAFSPNESDMHAKAGNHGPESLCGLLC